VRVVGSAHRKAAIPLPRGSEAAVSDIDVPVHVGLDHVLARRVQLRKRAPEFCQFCRRIHVKKWNVQAIVERPRQRQRPRFARYQFCDDGPVSRDLYINTHICLLYVNDLDAMVRLHPSTRSLIRALRVEVFNETSVTVGPTLVNPHAIR